jgi:hypothetical protein
MKVVPLSTIETHILYLFRRPKKKRSSFFILIQKCQQTCHIETYFVRKEVKEIMIYLFGALMKYVKLFET